MSKKPQLFVKDVGDGQVIVIGREGLGPITKERLEEFFELLII